MWSLETRFAFERSHLACSCKWALAEVGCSGASCPASVQPRQNASHCLSYCWWSFLLRATLLCMSCGSQWCGQADCSRDSPPCLHSQWRSTALPPAPAQGQELFTCSSRGGKNRSEPVLYLFPFSSRPRLPCLHFRLTALFSLDFAFVFLRGHQTISSKKAGLFNLNILRQSEGNGPHRPSAAWQVSMSQEEAETKMSSSCCHVNSQAGGHGVFGGRRARSQR